MSKTEEHELPPDPEGMNNKRAEWARAAIIRFREVCGGSRESDGSVLMDEAIGDLLSNIAHLCDREGMDPKGTFKRALACYQEETSE